MAEYLELIRMLATENFLLAGLLFWLLYVVSTTFSLPGASALTISAGAIFGIYAGTLLAFTAAYVGACIVFIVVKYFGSTYFKKKIEGTKIEKVTDKIKNNELLGLTVLRLLPIAPFFLVNIVAGVLGVKNRNYLIATLAMFPWSVAYVGVGAGLFTLFT